MNALVSKLRSLLRNLSGHSRKERELTDEVGSYVELSTARNIKAGMPENEARRAALLELGGVEQVKEQVREVRLGHFIETRMNDLRYAFRTLRKAPIFSLTVALILALGIGSTALIFTIINATLIQGPPFPESSRLFMLWGKIPQEPEVSFSPKEFTTWQQQTQVLESLAAFTGSGFALTDRGEPEMLIGQNVTPSLFSVLRVTPALGRVFLEKEAQAGQDDVVVLSDEVWRTKFQGRADALGQKINLNGRPYTIVGVMPKGFAFPRPGIKLWTPIAFDDAFYKEHPDAHLLRVLGRLKPAVTPAQLQAETDVIGRRIVQSRGLTDARFYSVSLAEQTSGELRAPLLVLLTAVILLLLIACANVANLMLARGKARGPEFAVRAALGASRPRLIAQLLTESTLLAVIGGLAGFALAIWSLELLRHFAVENIPQLLNARVDGAVIAFVFVISTASGVVFGIGPAWNASANSLVAGMAGATRSSAGRGATRSRNVLVFTEVALAAVLLIGCALMLRSFVRLSATDPGFNPNGVLIANVVASEERYPKAGQLLNFYQESLSKIAALPGVTAVGVVTHLPFGGNGWGNSFEIADRPADRRSHSASIRGISPGYLPALRLPLLRGRNFNERDLANSPGVALVSDNFAQRYFPNEDPIGKQLRYDRDWLTVVGVCGDVKHNRLDETPDSTIYLAYPADVSGRGRTGRT